MSFDTLTAEQRSFIDTHVLPGFAATVVQRRQAWVQRKTEEITKLLDALAPDAPEVLRRRARLASATALAATDFWKAHKSLRSVLADTKKIHAQAVEVKSQLAAALGPLVAPAGASDSERADIDALRQVVDEQIDGDKLPSRAGAKAAAAAIQQLTRKIAVIKKCAMRPAERKQIEALLVSSPETAKALMDEVAWCDGQIGSIPVDRAALETQAATLEAAKTERAQAAAALETVEAKSADDYDTPEAYDAALTEARERLTLAEAAWEEANDKLGYMRLKKALVDAVLVGPLAEDTPPPLSDQARRLLVERLSYSPSFASAGIAALQSSFDLDETLAMVTKLSGYVENEFEHGGATLPDGGWYGAQLIKTAASLPTEFAQIVTDYLDLGLHMVDKPIGDDPGPADRARHRTKLLVDELFDPSTGDVAVGTGAIIMYQHLALSPDALNHPTTALTAHMAEALAELMQPDIVAKFGAVTEPANDDAKSLVRQTLGLPADAEVTRGEAVQAALMAFLTPIDQGDVGSCFTTAPARRFRKEHPEQALEKFVELVSTGKYTAPSGRVVPAVTKLNEDGNPLVRSFEYTVAAVAASEDNSHERKAHRGMLFTPDGLGAVKDIVGDTDWPAVELTLKSFVTAAFRITYDPTIKTEKAADGSSSQGRFVLVIVKDYAGAKGTAVTDKAGYLAAMQLIGAHALKEFGYDPDADADKPKFRKMRELIASDAFADAVGGGKKTPWQMSSGGLERGPTKAMFGTDPTVTDLIVETAKPAETATPEEKARAEGRRTTEVLDALAASFEGVSDDQVTIGTAGIHAFNALPTDPSFMSVMDPDPAERKKKIKAVLLDPGRKIADTPLAKDRAVYLYDREVGPFLSGADEDMKAALKSEIDSHRPSADVTPGELRAAVGAALEAHAEARGKKAATAWWAAELEGGAIPTLEALKKKQAEEKRLYQEAFEAETTAALLKELCCPQVKIADTNWGDAGSHVYFVMAPDPGTGELRLWKRTEPDGSLRAAGDEWVYTTWDMTA